MAPLLYHGLAAFGLPVICIESRQVYQALKSLATHKTDRNDARGMAHLARTGFFKPTHVESPPPCAAGACRARESWNASETACAKASYSAFAGKKGPPKPGVYEVKVAVERGGSMLFEHSGTYSIE